MDKDNIKRQYLNLFKNSYYKIYVLSQKKNQGIPEYCLIISRSHLKLKKYVSGIIKTTDYEFNTGLMKINGEYSEFLEKFFNHLYTISQDIKFGTALALVAKKGDV